MTADIKSRILDPETPPFERLVLIMTVLRSKDGCSWDRKQTHKSLLPYLIEEAYEVAETVEKEDFEALKDELGDLVCQAVFHAQLASEAGRFDINDSLRIISDKLIRRHPHVFGDRKDLKPDEVRDQWEQIKLKSEDKTSVLGGLPRSMPALLMAYRLGEKAAGVGFDWKSAPYVLDKIEEELQEIKAEIKVENTERLADEIGDMLFAVASLARKYEVDPELALKNSLTKFRLRFERIEKMALSRKHQLYDLTPDELNRLWESAKKSDSDG